MTLFVAEKVLNITQLAWTGKNNKCIIYHEIAATNGGFRISELGLALTYNLASFFLQKKIQLHASEKCWAVRIVVNHPQGSVSKVRFLRVDPEKPI